jgi:hypothetical protein
VEACVQKLLQDHKDVASEHGHWKKVKEKRGITVHLSHEEVRTCPQPFSSIFLFFIYLFYLLIFFASAGESHQGGQGAWAHPRQPEAAPPHPPVPRLLSS